MAGELQLGISPEEFLAQYWQRKPLLIRGAFPDFIPPVDSDTLAGLALEEEIESRIIEQAEGTWHIHHGPFIESDFQRANPWTLLVQAVDHYLPEVDALRRCVTFLPQWRLDDVMVSYAVDGGSVGPHFDNYDVFLLQGEGRRRWKIGQHCDDTSALLPHDQLRILAEFQAVDEYLLEPGDMLYVPPGVAHWGIAEGECTTFSIGFRAPRIAELVSRWTDSLLEQLPSDNFLTDAGRAVASRDGEITPEDINTARHAVHAALDKHLDARWFGELVTEPRYDPLPENTQASLALILAGRCRAVLSGGAKLAWVQQGEELLVFANGDSLFTSPALQHFIETLCRSGHSDGTELTQHVESGEFRELLDFLLEVGCIHAESDEP